MSRFLSTVLLGFLIGLLSVSIFSQAPIDSIVDRPIDRFRVRRSHLVDALNHLSSQFKIPIGLEKISEQTKRGNDFALDLKGASVSEILDAIVQEDGRHDWKFEDGVIRVRPSIGVDDCARKLSDTQISKFDFNGRVSYLNLRSMLTSIPEVKYALSACNLAIPHIDSFRIEVGALPAFSIDIKEERLSSVLNSIIKQGSRKMWIVTLPSEDGGQMVLNFL